MPDSEVVIREFEPGDETAFRALNEEWIIRYFALEPKDRESLEDPKGVILDRGGRIFFAVLEGRPAGCCALIPAGPGDYEVAKMAVTESCQGKGIGKKLLQAVIASARAAGATRLHLETNSKLATAIHLYESVGFKHLPPDRFIPSPYARCNVQMELHLESSTQTAA
jgi:GNAT superfamily N-acetyltransferase